MTQDSELEALVGARRMPGQPRLEAVRPDVRSGATFVLTGAGAGAAEGPVMVVWNFDVAAARARDFHCWLEAKEGLLAALVASLSGQQVAYLGTFALAFGAAGQARYRTYWRLASMGALDGLAKLLVPGPDSPDRDGDLACLMAGFNGFRAESDGDSSEILVRAAGATRLWPAEPAGG
jgi:hypothetical protein